MRDREIERERVRDDGDERDERESYKREHFKNNNYNKKR
jgi:hypothetical protein